MAHVHKLYVKHKKKNRNKMILIKMSQHRISRFNAVVMYIVHVLNFDVYIECNCRLCTYQIVLLTYQYD